MALSSILNITGLSCGLLGSILLSIEFVGVRRVQSLLVRILKIMTEVAKLVAKANLMVVGGLIILIIVVMTRTPILKFLPTSGAFYWLNTALSLIFFSLMVMRDLHEVIKGLFEYKKKKPNLRYPKLYLVVGIMLSLFYPSLIAGMLVFRPPGDPLFQEPNNLTMGLLITLAIGLITVGVFLLLTRVITSLLNNFYREKQEEQIRVLGISGLGFLMASFAMQITATLLK